MSPVKSNFRTYVFPANAGIQVQHSGMQIFLVMENLLAMHWFPACVGMTLRFARITATTNMLFGSGSFSAQS